MHIPLPNGDALIPDIEFAEKIGVTRRTLGTWIAKAVLSS